MRRGLLGVMGWPVGHSLSPPMQAAAIRAAGLELEFVKLPVAPGDLADAVRGARALGFLGFNVTIPHKQAIVPLLDELTEEASALGAVNAVRIGDEGRLVGHNTDATGALDALREAFGADVRGKCALVLGAGGAGRAVALGCARAGAGMVVVGNRTAARAEALCAEIRERHPAVAARVLRPGAPPPGEASLVFQMSSGGMDGNPAELVIDPEALSPRAVVLEAVYRPRETAFLRACREQGLRCLDGLSMLLAQGAASFEFWTGIAADRRAMRLALESAASAD